MPRTLDPRRALAHPLWWVALALLAANDHLFKGAGVLPAALTGKLSDIVGLLVAPALLAALCGVRRRRGWLAAHLAVGAGFAAINLSPAVARAVEAATLATPWPWIITVDPTDLVALPMLAVSAWVFARWSARPVALRPLVARAGVALGGLACVATSSPSEPPPSWTDAGFEFDEASAHLMIANRGDEAAAVRIRRLSAEVQLDCAALADDPAAALSPDLFGAPTVWSIEPDRGVPLLATRPSCDAFLLGGATGNHLVFFQIAQWRPTRIATGGDGLAGAAVIEFDAEGTRAHPTVYRAPTRTSTPPVPACQNPAVGAGVDWTRPAPTLRRRVVEHTVAADGCHALELIEPGRGVTERWYFCAPGVPLSFEVDEAVDFDEWEQGVQLRLDDRRITLYQTDVLPGDVLLEAEPLEGCPPYRDACDSYMQPLALRHGAEAYVAGERGELIDGRDLYVVRAEQPLALDTRCAPFAGLAPQYELVVVDRFEAPEEDAR